MKEPRITYYPELERQIEIDQDKLFRMQFELVDDLPQLTTDELEERIEWLKKAEKRLEMLYYIQQSVSYNFARQDEREARYFENRETKRIGFNPVEDRKEAAV